MKSIEKLSETPSFGRPTKFVGSLLNLDGSFNRTVETLALTKKQAIASAAKLDNTMLMQVIDRVEELESKTKEVAPKIPTSEELLAMSTETLKALAAQMEANQEAC